MHSNSTPAPAARCDATHCICVCRQALQRRTHQPPSCALWHIQRPEHAHAALQHSLHSTRPPSTRAKPAAPGDQQGTCRASILQRQQQLPCQGGNSSRQVQGQRRSLPRAGCPTRHIPPQLCSNSSHFRARLTQAHLLLSALRAAHALHQGGNSSSQHQGTSEACRAPRVQQGTLALSSAAAAVQLPCHAWAAFSAACCSCHAAAG